MYPTGVSYGYAANNYRTADKVNRNVNTFVAIATLIISLLSFACGLVTPNTHYHNELSALNQQILEIIK